MALGHSRRRWFGTCSCKPVPRGLPSSDKQLRAAWPHGLSRSWRTIVGNPSVTRPNGQRRVRCGVPVTRDHNFLQADLTLLIRAEIVLGGQTVSMLGLVLY